MNAVRVGLVGCGRIARLTHLHALRRARAVEIVAAADSFESARHAFAEAAPDVRVFDSVDRMIAVEKVEALVVATPPNTHFEIGLAALRAGLHVYLEKPMAVSLEEAKELYGLSCSSNRVAMIGFNQRAHPLMRRARAMLASGQIGTPTMVRTVFSSVRRDLPPWKQKRESGGGALLDLAAHHLDLLPWLLGAKIDAVSASLCSRHSEHDNALLALRFDDGLEGHIAASMIGCETDRIEIIGENGAILIDRFAGAIDILPAKRKRERKDRILAAASEIMALPSRVLRAALPPTDPSYCIMFERFADAIARNVSVAPDFGDGLDNMRVIAAAEKSANNGGRFEVIDRPRVTNHAIEQPLNEGEQSSKNNPELSVILVGSEGYGSIARVAEHLRRQTVASSIELILIGPCAERMTRDARRLDGFFHSIKAIEVGVIDNVDTAAAPGISAASAPLVAIVEDHAFPAPGWANAIVEAHKAGPWVAVGSMVKNANPSSTLSWANQMMSYGEWTEPVQSGQTQSISRHNVSFKTEAVRAIDDLERQLGRDGNLLGALLKTGGTFFLEPRAAVEHVNPSRWDSTLLLRIEAGRLAAAKRSAREGWSPVRRLVYVACGPLIPLMRARPHMAKVLSTARPASLGKMAAALAIGSILDGIGQTIGFAFGSGHSAVRLADFEMGRDRHLRDDDRQRLSGLEPTT